MWSQLQQLDIAGLLKEDEQEEHDRHQRPFYFCDQPHGEYAHVVFSAVGSNRSLWNLESIKSMCQMDQVMRSSELFPAVCQHPTDGHQCCPSWTLGHYVAVMRNRTSCDDIDVDDVSVVFNILEACSKHYHGLQLSPNCDSIVQEGKTSLEF